MCRSCIPNGCRHWSSPASRISRPRPGRRSMPSRCRATAMNSAWRSISRPARRPTWSWSTASWFRSWPLRATFMTSTTSWRAGTSSRPTCPASSTSPPMTARSMPCRPTPTCACCGMTSRSSRRPASRSPGRPRPGTTCCRRRPRSRPAGSRMPSSCPPAPSRARRRRCRASTWRFWAPMPRPTTATACAPGTRTPGSATARRCAGRWISTARSMSTRS